VTKTTVCEPPIQCQKRAFIELLGSNHFKFPVDPSCIKCDSVNIEHKYEAKMSVRKLETQIINQTRSSDSKTVAAKIKTRFEFFYNGELIPAVHITEVSIRVRPSTPQHRVIKKIENAAWEDVCAYMNGDDTIGDGDNIFSDVKLGNEKTSLSAEQECGLLQELDKIERELHIAA
jgi:hypothetical protein